MKILEMKNEIQMKQLLNELKPEQKIISKLETIQVRAHREKKA